MISAEVAWTAIAPLAAFGLVATSPGSGAAQTGARTPVPLPSMAVPAAPVLGNGLAPGPSTAPRTLDPTGPPSGAGPVGIQRSVAAPTCGSRPLLVLTNRADRYSGYIREMLATEGIKSLAQADAATLRGGLSLRGYCSLVLSRGVTLNSAQVKALTAWVSSGGTLVVMRPAANLAGLMGLGRPAGVMSDKYLKVNAASAPGAGITTRVMQYHGMADLRPLRKGTKAVATVYRSSTEPTAYAAVTLRTYGRGQAMAWLYDLPRSVVLTRQGNPRLAGQLTLSDKPRAADMFARGWLDVGKMAIPQADEQQRLLVNMIQMKTAPIPRLWYFPAFRGGLPKAAVIMTGDDESATSSTVRRFTAELQAARRCSVAAWTCPRSTSYTFPGAITDAQAGRFARLGFEVSTHIAGPHGSCPTGWTNRSGYEAIFGPELVRWKAAYPSLRTAYPPLSSRSHCITWADWDSVAQVEAANRMLLDSNYYCWPKSFLDRGQCLFSGTGMPQRFANLDGTTVNIYQSTTVMTDENPNTVSRAAMAGLLHNATGPNGYYGYFNANLHMTGASEGIEATLRQLAGTSVPVVSARQVAQFWSQRDKTTLTTRYAARSVAVSVGAAPRNAVLMLPHNWGSKRLSSISRYGRAVKRVAFDLKKIRYDCILGASGSYVATYR